MNEIVKAADKPLRQVGSVRELLVNNQARDQLAKVAARHLSPDRIMRIMANAIRTTPKLGECEPMSLLGAMMNAAALGLEPNTPLGHAYLIPFENRRKNIVEVQLIVGYKGYADMARRSGQIKSLHADVVYSDDELWSYEYGSNMHLRHKPGKREGQKVAAYAHVTLSDGEGFVVLPWAEVMKVRNNSQGYRSAVQYKKDHPWISHEDRMASKTAVRALANRGELPLSIEFMEAMEADETPGVDYGTFARDPGAGLTIDGTVASEEDDPPVVEDEGEAPAEETTPKQEETPPPKQTAREPAKSTKGQQPAGGQLPLDQAAKPTPARRKQLEDLSRIVLMDAEVDAAQARTYHTKKIEEIRAEAPDLLVELENELAAFERAQADRGEDE